MLVRAVDKLLWYCFFSHRAQYKINIRGLKMDEVVVEDYNGIGKNFDVFSNLYLKYSITN